MHQTHSTPKKNAHKARADLPTVRDNEPETPVYGSLFDMVRGRTMGDDARDPCDTIDFSMSIDFDYR